MSTIPLGIGLQWVGMSSQAGLLVVTCPKCGVEKIYQIKTGNGTLLIGCKHCKRSFRLTVQNGQVHSIEP
jgi:hypothetical protein